MIAATHSQAFLSYDLFHTTTYRVDSFCFWKVSYNVGSTAGFTETQDHLWLDTLAAIALAGLKPGTKDYSGKDVHRI